MNKKLIENSVQKHSEALKLINEDALCSAGDMLLEAINNDGTIFWCGNGGSASQANHLSAELIGGMYQEKNKPFKSICLNVDTAFITAWSNDFGFDGIFAGRLRL